MGRNVSWRKNDQSTCNHDDDDDDDRSIETKDHVVQTHNFPT